MKAPQARSCSVSIPLFLFFLLLQFILSLDFGFIRKKSSKIRVIVKFLNLFQFMCLILLPFYAVFIEFNIFRAFAYVYFVTQYLIMVSIFFFHNKNRSFCSFLENLNYIDAEMKVYSRFCQIDLKIIFLLSFMFISKFSICACLCFFYFPFSCHGTHIGGLLLFLCSFSINVPLLLYSFTFYSSYCRLKTLKAFVQHRKCSYIHGAFIYKFIIDSTEIARKVFDYVTIVALLFRVPEMLVIIYITLKHIKFALMDASDFAMVYALLVFYLVVLLSPAIVANLLCCEASKLRLLLHDMCLTDRGAENDIQRFINYIEARPFKFYILFQVIPLNAKLPLILINISVTYLIIVLQLSHVY